MTTDIDQASRTQCLDISTMEWSKEIADVIGIDLDEVLPKPQLVNDIIGFCDRRGSSSDWINCRDSGCSRL